MGNKTKVKQKSKVGKVIKIILLLMLLAGIIYGCIFAYKVKQNGGGLSGILKTAVGHNEETKRNLKTINILLLGESGVGDGYKLTDSIMICSYNPNAQQASILSIPRDFILSSEKSVESAKNLRQSSAYFGSFCSISLLRARISLTPSSTSINIGTTTSFP